MKWPAAFSIATLSTLLALAARLMLMPWLDARSPFMIFALSILVSGYTGGMGMGLYATWLGATMGRLLLVEPYYSLSLPDPHSKANLLLFVLIGVSLSVLAPLARRGQELALRMEHQEKERALREAALEEKAVQDERQRLSRELHDSVSQALYGIGLGARTALAQAQKNPERLEATLNYVLTLAESGLADMRALVHELRPELLESEGLAAALGQQARALASRHGLEARLELREPEVSLTHKHGLYRVAMEALHNTVKHAHANHVEVRLEPVGSELLLEVKDDGKGFDCAADYPGHWGIRTMRERVERFGGLLELESQPGQGSRVRVRLPLEEPAGGESRPGGRETKAG